MQEQREILVQAAQDWRVLTFPLQGEGLQFCVKTGLAAEGVSSGTNGEVLILGASATRRPVRQRASALENER